MLGTRAVEHTGDDFTCLIPSDAQRLLDCIAPGESLTFQTFDESRRKRRELNRILHGTLYEHVQTLQQLQGQGAGVFVMVNRGDGKGRKGRNVTAVRAVFVDLDGAPIQPVLDAPLRPHAIVETSPDRFHAYWRVSDCPLDRFTEMQLRLIARFGADPTVKDLPRVMRLPGYTHLKGKPFCSRTVSLESHRPYRLAELELAFPEPRAKEQTPTSVTSGKKLIAEGKRNNSLLSMGATWRNCGFSRDGVLQRLRTANRERCTPPLPDSEVYAVLESVFRYPRETGVILSPTELDALRAVPASAWKVYVAAKLQFSAGNALISLTLKDMSAYGFRNARTLAAAIRNAQAAGLLTMYRAPVYQRKGERRLCGLYTLPLCAKLP